LFTTPVLLAELQDVLNRPKFTQRLAQAGVTASTLVVGFAALAVLVRPANIAPVVLVDPDDDAVLACAIAAQAQAIVSGDSHLLSLGQYQGIPIWTPAQMLAVMP
jgi:putative PIN family toxin of toxin-antitoxin system